MTPAVSRPPDDDEAHPYVITNEIGKGSFATVYRGYHNETRRAVAIKTISRSILTTKLLDNLESEINILKSLKNRHITELTDIVKAHKHIYLIMEFCSGGDLSSYIKHRGRIAALHTPTSPMPTYLPHPKVGGLSDSVVRSFIGQLSSAMKFLRARDLIHRDVKPQNLLLSPANSVEEYACVGKGGWIPGPVGTPILKVADFGFARILPNASMAETLCGSPLYMAPEILRYEKYDAKADLWSVGAVVYEAAVGRPPFRAQNHIELLKKIDHARSRVHFPDEDPKNADTIARGDLIPVSPEVKLLIRSLLKRKSVERKSFEDFFAAAEDVVKPVMEPERDVGSELADAMKDATLGGSMGGTGSANGSLKVEVRAIEFPGHRPKPLPLVNGQVKKVDSNQSFHSAKAGPAPEGEEEVDNDGDMRREYVLVDETNAVEFNRVVDELDHARLARPTIRTTKSTPPTSATTAPIDVPTSASPTRANGLPQPSPASTPASALARALNLASKKLFGTSASSHSGSSAGPAEGSPAGQRRQILLPPTREPDAEEELLLGTLEDLAQKAETIAAWADSKYTVVASRPTKPIADPARFERAAGESAKGAETRRKHEVEIELAAVTAIGLYMAVMSFATGAIVIARRFLDGREGVEVSAGFDEGTRSTVRRNE
ncbi:Serine/threonine-protein kinase [Ceratobasidium sp. 423]|nr:Serine/threonine-protein kinase [Ceratobasidium sp. 423]